MIIKIYQRPKGKNTREKRYELRFQENLQIIFIRGLLKLGLIIFAPSQ